MKKDVKFSTRMASTDREAIKELAKQSGMSMSDYVTACCLGKQVVVIDGLKEVLKELKSILMKSWWIRKPGISYRRCDLISAAARIWMSRICSLDWCIVRTAVSPWYCTGRTP